MRHLIPLLLATSLFAAHKETGWHWTAKLERPGDPAEILDALIQELEADWDSGGSE
jgi:hypothetical protein